MSKEDATHLNAQMGKLTALRESLGHSSNPRRERERERERGGEREREREERRQEGERGREGGRDRGRKGGRERQREGGREGERIRPTPTLNPSPPDPYTLNPDRYTLAFLHPELTTPILQGYLTHKKTLPPQDPAVGLLLRSWRGPRGVGVFLGVRYPCTTLVS